MGVGGQGEVKKTKIESSENASDDQWVNIDSGPSSPHSDSPGLTPSDDLSDGSFLDVEDTPISNSK